jgi:hypothetical protein
MKLGERLENRVLLHIEGLLEGFRKFLRSFQKLPESFQKLSETFQEFMESFWECPEGFRPLASSFRAIGVLPWPPVKRCPNSTVQGSLSQTRSEPNSGRYVSPRENSVVPTTVWVELVALWAPGSPPRRDLIPNGFAAGLMSQGWPPPCLLAASDSCSPAVAPVECCL